MPFVRAVRLFAPVAAALSVIWPSELVSSAAESARQAAVSAASVASYTETIPGTNVTFDMVAVPGGTFQMGSPPGESGRDSDEGPVHAVTVRPFWIGKFEVTWDEYDRYAFSTDAVPPPGGSAPTSGDAVTRPTPPYGDESFGFGKERQPAINMTHHGAMEYTHWLSRVTGKAYRLPTEAEWEFAARAGSAEPYSFGSDARSLGEYAWYEANAEDRPHPVGQKKPNALGIHDMHGNIAEWCLDQYDDDFYKRAAKEGSTAGALIALLPGPGRFPHVVRGGSWADDAKELRSAARRGSTERWSRRDPQNPRSIWWHTDGTIVGFRVVRASDEYPELRGFRSKMTPNSPDR